MDTDIVYTSLMGTKIQVTAERALNRARWHWENQTARILNATDKLFLVNRHFYGIQFTVEDILGTGGKA